MCTNVYNIFATARVEVHSSSSCCIWSWDIIVCLTINDIIIKFTELIECSCTYKIR